MAPTYCRKGHFIGREEDYPGLDWDDVLTRSLQRNEDGKLLPSFCVRCGSKNLSACEHCSTPFYENIDCELPLYCGGCGRPLPWTESSLAAADAYTDELDTLSTEQKAELKTSFKDLTTDSAATPIAASRFKRIMVKAGPAVQAILTDVLRNIVTGEAKKYLGF